MPELKWNEYDFIECLGVLPEKEEFFTSHYFELSRDDLFLQITVWQHESCVAVSISKESDKQPFIIFHLLVRDEIIFINEKESSFLRFQNCIIVSSRFWMNREIVKLLDQQNDHSNKKDFPSKIDFELHVYPRLEIKFD